METIFAIIENGVVANVIVADEWPDGVNVTDLVPRPGIGWQYIGGQFIAPTAPGSDPEIPPNRRMTRLDFRRRFAQEELVMIEIACLDDPSAPMQQRAQAAALRVMQAQVNTAEFIDLDDPLTRSGVEQLEAAGLLAEGRAAEILG